MSAVSPRPRVNPWKISTFVLLGALVAVVSSGSVGTAEAAGPLRLGKALAALKSSKKLLEDAKDPPAPFHQQSMMLVGQAIGAVEKEIKAYETAQATKKDKDKDKDKGAAGDRDKKKDAGAKEGLGKKKPPVNDSAEE